MSQKMRDEIKTDFQFGSARRRAWLIVILVENEFFNLLEEKPISHKAFEILVGLF